MVDIIEIRKNFPILNLKIKDKQLVYLDNAATTLKPKSVVDRIANHYLYETSNVHRGLHYLSDQATENFEKARRTVAQFINCKTEEVVFTKGTTDSINIVARSYACLLPPKSTILISELEHHSNIVPWQQAALKYNLNVESFAILENGMPDLEDFKKKLKAFNVSLAAFTFVSNSLGTIFPVKELTKLAHEHGAKVLVDAAQAVAHQKVDVQELDCDFLVFSGHKLFGPTGIGVLFGKYELLEKMPPFEVGGGMIDAVTLKETTFLNPPFRFEAGTPHIAGIIGLGAAIDFIKQFSFPDIQKYETDLTRYLESKLSDIPHIKIFGEADKKGPIVSFIVEGENSSDVGSLLDNDAIAVRAGHHCTQPLMKRLGTKGTVRVSLAFYNTKDEVDYFVNSLKKVISILKA